MQYNQTHLFAIFAPNLKLHAWSVDQSAAVHDADLLHRLTKVLRFAQGDQIIFFDAQFFAQVQIKEISKKSITVQVQTIAQHQPLTPQIIFLLPLLKKEALEQAVYSLCELGINKIQLVITQKSRQNLLSDKEFVRLQNIVIAAAEQSKNYSMSQLLLPKKLSEVISVAVKSFSIVFDPAGVSFFDVREKMKLKFNLFSCLPGEVLTKPGSSRPASRDPVQLQNSFNISLLVGPEGGLTDQELSLVQKSEFVSCALTPTILTAIQAVALGAGLFRLKH